MKPLLHPETNARLTSLLDRPPHATLILGGPIGNHKNVAEYYADQLARRLKCEVQSYIDEQFTIDTVRALRGATRTSSLRVVVLPPFENAALEAQNALLKELEEPSAGTHFALSALTSDALLSTILSRVQPVELRLPSEADFIQAFEEHPEADVKAALAASRGWYDAFITYLSGERDEYELAKKFVAADVSQRMQLLGQAQLDRPSAIRVVSYIQSIFIFLMEAGRGDVQRHAERIEACMHTLKHLRANGNIKLALDDLCINL